VFKTAIDDPRRFRHSKTVGAYLGLTSRRWPSGASIDVQGDISQAGDGEVRHPLYEAANIMLTRYRGFTSLKAWGLKIARQEARPPARLRGGGAQARRDHARGTAPSAASRRRPRIAL
jgi:transposase